jgi:hypothetical protein
MPTPLAHRRHSLPLTSLAVLALLACGVARATDEDKAARPAADATAAGARDAKGPEQRVVLFNGKDLSGWKFREERGSDAWKVVDDVKLDPSDPKKLVGSGVARGLGGALLRGPIEHGSDLYTEKSFGDCELHVDFMVPRASNSGVYLMGRYEVQVLDSHGKPADRLGQGDVGAIYSAAKPSKNASKPAGEWQTFDIVFQAPRFDADGKKTKNAKFVSVKLNGEEIQREVEVKGPTGSQLYNDEKPTGPILFQGDHGIVAFRNVWIKPKQATPVGEESEQ